jgi:hypothetical protein
MLTGNYYPAIFFIGMVCSHGMGPDSIRALFFWGMHNVMNLRTIEGIWDSLKLPPFGLTFFVFTTIFF